MNTASNLAHAGAAAIPSRPFERIEEAANKAESLVMSVNAFLDRVHGNPPQGHGGAEVASPTGYLNQIDRLHSALNSLQTLAEALHGIG